MTAVAAPAAAGVTRRFRPGRRTVIGVAAVLAVAAYPVVRATGAAQGDDAAAFRFLTDVRTWVDANRDSSPLFLYGVNYLRLGVVQVVDGVHAVLSWLGGAGLIAAAGALGFLLSGWRVAVVAVAGLLGVGWLGLWDEGVATLALTLAAVLLSVLAGVPLGVLSARVRWVGALLRPLLDVMQIMPTFAYLAPMTLLFLIGEPAAVIATVIYAVPVTIRITALGVGTVDATAVEAATALGSTPGQVLRKVRLPLAAPAIVLAIHQTIMMALSMVVVTALIDAPGLGQTIVQALERVNVGVAFDAGLAIVLLAIVLDRLTGLPRKPRRRPAVLAVVVTALAVLVPWGPAHPAHSFAAPVNDLTGWVELHWYDATEAIKNAVSAVLLDPLETVLTGTPWWYFVLVVAVLGTLTSGWRPALTAAAAAAGIAGLGLWPHAMQTLASVLVAMLVTMAAGVLLGVLSARHDRFAAVLHPLLNAAQTMPSFVYLLPAVALFGASRFTAIVAAVIFAVPPVVRLVERGLRDVPGTVVEAALSAGSTPRQLLWKVQLPMARPGLLLAANQGIVMVLAMVVVGGLVGAGALGYDVVAGFAQREDFGRGLAAGFAIVLLGIVLDRLIPKGRPS
ncbi:proline/glycine betaine ABC transporter permease [Actinoplanes sp. N902-109]|uniref:ABC transporter permease n=1 Tax=Actinoplanes sp. (strain N902-109) TaxID=649831 RepID=UPI00032944C3|nr:ABC transporter permease subunit [Actinoplanes sp. N902-109]AGL17599.1 binding-protein-dependent transporter inner membrane component [Actinoplanes sp. N902-109]